MKQGKIGISGFYLKMIAMASMLIDHTGAALFPQYIELRMIGRLAFPIYCFLLVEGAIHTLDIKKYQKRLFLFALLSEMPFDLVHTGKLFDFQAQNVFFTLFLGLTAIRILAKSDNKIKKVIYVVLILLLAEFAQIDYSSSGVLIIMCFYLFYNRNLVKSVSFGVVNSFFGGIQNYALFSLIPILLYNGERGKKVKYIFYIFYPAHLLVLYWIKYGIIY
ncbi:conjugal transfer protein TraX [Lachnospiraceae bacterium ZAX-1]